MRGREEGQSVISVPHPSGSFCWAVPSIPVFSLSSRVPQEKRARLGPAWPRLAYALAFFHAIVLERRRYGPLGWCAPYQFSGSDLHVALENLEAMLAATVTTSTDGGGSEGEGRGMDAS